MNRFTPIFFFVLKGIASRATGSAMGIFRKRVEPETEPELDKLLDGYSATRMPSTAHSKVETIMCWRCHRPNVFDARLTRPVNCGWCRALL